MKCNRRLFSIVAVLVCATVAGTQAQGVEGAAAAAAGSMDMTWKDIFQYGGGTLYVIALVSVFAVANVLTLFYTLRTSVVVPRGLVRDVVTKIRDGALGEARALCEDRPGPFASIAATAIDYVQSAPDADPGLVKDILTGEGVRQATRIQGGTQWLLDIAAIAPMLGLLGTVLGMMMAFSAVAGDVAGAKPVLLAQGVARALITTIGGLLVAVPAQAFYAWFRRSASRLIAQLETASHELLTALLHQRVR